MKIVIRTDSSQQIGSGHVMRCLTLADELRQRGAEVLFVCRELPGNLISFIEGKGYQVMSLHQPDAEYCAMPDDVAHAAWLGFSWGQDAEDTINALPDEKPQWLIVDHYSLDCRWEEILRNHVGKIMVIDDIADRKHYCDILLDQNFYRNVAARYKDLVPTGCIKLLGPCYSLLRAEFYDIRRNLRIRDGTVERLLVSFGGSDLSDETGKTLTALKKLGSDDLKVDVVVGGTYCPHFANIIKLCSELTFVELHQQVSYMASLMSRADLFIGAGGATSLERFFLGLPSIIWAIAENQLETTRDQGDAGLAINLGWHMRVGVDDIVSTVQNALANPEAMRELSRRSLSLFENEDGQMHHLVQLILSGGNK